MFKITNSPVGLKNAGKFGIGYQAKYIKYSI